MEEELCKLEIYLSLALFSYLSDHYWLPGAAWRVPTLTLHPSHAHETLPVYVFPALSDPLRSRFTAQRVFLNLFQSCLSLVKLVWQSGEVSQREERKEASCLAFGDIWALNREMMVGAVSPRSKCTQASPHALSAPIIKLQHFAGASTAVGPSSCLPCCRWEAGLQTGKYPGMWSQTWV